MPNPYDGDVVLEQQQKTPAGECVLGKGVSEQKANLAGMLHAMETVTTNVPDHPAELIFTCCCSGETGKHDAMKRASKAPAARANMAVLPGAPDFRSRSAIAVTSMPT